MSVKRIWHGWTTHENADAYQKLLHEEVLPGIEAKNIPGYRGVEVLRRELEEEVEFVTIMTYDSLENVVGLQGKDYERAYIPDAAAKVLKRWNSFATHYEEVEVRGA